MGRFNKISTPPPAATSVENYWRVGVGKVAINIAGRVFNGLTAIKATGEFGCHMHWLFKCHCGNEFVARKSKVVTGLTKSCGCLKAKTMEVSK